MDTRSRADALLLQGFPPVTTRDARVLVLGSMPGVASLEANRYYAHPRNAFWPIMGALVGADPALPYARRLARLKAAGIALWDVLDRCEREGSLDSAIVDATAQANDFAAYFTRHARLTTVLFNGAKAQAAHRRFGPYWNRSGFAQSACLRRARRTHRSRSQKNWPPGAKRCRRPVLRYPIEPADYFSLISRKRSSRYPCAVIASG